MNRKECVRQLQLKKIKYSQPFKLKLALYFSKCKSAVNAGHNPPSILPVLEEYNKTIVSGLFKDASDKLKALMSRILTLNDNLIKKHAKDIDRTSLKRLKSSHAAAKEAHKETKTETKENYNLLNDGSFGYDTFTDIITEYKEISNKTIGNKFDEYNQKRIPMIVKVETNSLFNNSRINIIKLLIPIFNALIKQTKADDDDLDDDDEDELDDIDSLADSEQISEAREKHHAVVIALISKTWDCQFDNSCDECKSLHGETVPINEPFSNGADFPGDNIHPNCNCDLII